MIKNTIKTTGYVALAFATSSLAQAQTPPDAGSILRDQQKPVLELPTRTAPAIKVEEPARPALAPSAARFVLKSVRISSNTVFTERELVALVQDYIGKEVGFIDLDQATARISRYYRERGYTVARAYLPAQDIQDGAVEIAVIEGRFGKVNINNKSRVRDSVVKNYAGPLTGITVYEPSVERKLLIINELPGVGEARASMSPGANVGESDLAIEVTEGPLASGSVELDNHGNRFTGSNRITGQFNWLSPLGLGDQLSSRLTKGFDGLEFGRVNYQLPIGGDGFKLGVAYSNSHYRLGRNFAALNANGKSDTYALNVSYPFIRSRNLNVFGQVSYDWRDFQDRVGATATVTDKQTRGASFTLSGDEHDTFAGGGISVFSLGYSDGQVNIQTPAARAIDNASARTHGHYSKWHLSLIRQQAIIGPLSAYIALSGQKANQNLDSSEKFVLGGPSGVRAYAPGEASGDSGYLASVELRYTTSAGVLPGVLQPFMFFDAGDVTVSENPFVLNARNHRRLTGAGLGITWSKVRDFHVTLSVATRVGAQPSLASDTDRHTRGWLQAVKYF